MAPSSSEFLRHLERSRLIPAEELERFLRSFPPKQRPQDAQSLAKELIRSGKLTKYQASRIYRGKSRGLVLGNYVILDKIGRGGMGDVYRAQHVRMKRVVALKVLAGHITRSRRARRRFQREVETAARLVHPNIVTAFDADEDQGLHYLVMEYVDGDNLAAIVDQGEPVSVICAVDWIRQAAQGLAYAHAEGVIHRDVKPQNLLLASSQTVKVLDMGLVALMDDEGSEGLTKDSHVVGTVDYMAPEQSDDGAVLDARVDIYALGCTLCRLLVGRPPYEADSPLKKLLAHREKPIPSLRNLRPDVPACLDLLFQRMLAKQPEGRPGSMLEVIEALDLCQQELEQPAAALPPAAREPAVRAELPLPTSGDNAPGPAARPAPDRQPPSGAGLANDPRASSALPVAVAPPRNRASQSAQVAPRDTESAVLQFIQSLDQDPAETDPELEFTTSRADQSTVSNSGIHSGTGHRNLRRRRQAEQQRTLLMMAACGAIIGLLMLTAWYWGRTTGVVIDWPDRNRYDARVLVDGQPAPLPQGSEATPLSLAPGRHEISFQRRGYSPQTRIVTLTRGQQPTLKPDTWEPVVQQD